MPDSVRCPDCDLPMEEGFVLEERPGSRYPSSWVKGPPEPSVWVGTRIGGRERLRIQTYRCTACGLLKSYALEPHRDPR